MTTRAPRKPDIEHPGETDMFSKHRPSYSSYCRHCAATVQRKRTINALYLALKGFGYTTLTVAETEAAYDLAMAGPVESGDIIAMLIRSQLEQAGVVA
jgi:hypothetical protein